MRTLAAGVVLLIGVVAGPAAAAPAPLEDARAAAEHTSFDGVLEVRWRDVDGMHVERLTVQAAAGALMVTGANQVMARPALGRLVAHAGGGWQEIWLPSVAPAPRPDGVPKYATTAFTPGPPVAGRPTKVVDIRHNDRVVERLYLDSETQLLLERDQFDADGNVTRTLAFASLTLNPGEQPPPAPASPANHAPDEVSPSRLPSPAAAPPTLPDGYQRTGIYRSGPVAQALYSDGVYDLSVFQQRGRLRTSDLPATGEPVQLAGATGRRYTWPGGQVVVWARGGTVFTAVSDAPLDQVVTAVRSLPLVSTRELSFLGKVRRACQALMEPLS